MAVDNQSFTMYIDSHGELEFTVDDIESLVGCNIVWKMAKSKHAKPVIAKTSDDVEEISTDENKFTVYYKPKDNKNIAMDVYYHEARITDADGNSRPVVNGIVTIIQTLTSSG